LLRALREQWCYRPRLGDVAAKRAAMAASARTILVADSAKFARTAIAVICPADQIDVLVTDPAAPEEEVAALRRAGVEVVLGCLDELSPHQRDRS